MPEKTILNLTSLKDQVYDYLRKQMTKGELQPGSVIDMKATSRKLGVSRTPLRDALIQLEMEGFVKILPRRGVVVNWLTVQDIREYYEILGALEGVAVISASQSMGEAEIERMQKLNRDMAKAIEKDDFDFYYEKNLEFHNVYIDLSGNRALQKITGTMKRRLYDFPRRSGYVREWEEASISEHGILIELLAAGKFVEASNFIKDVHWSFEVQEEYIKKYYSESYDFDGIKRPRKKA